MGFGNSGVIQEDPHGWRPTGIAHDCMLDTRDLALETARKAVTWLYAARTT